MIGPALLALTLACAQNPPQSEPEAAQAVEAGEVPLHTPEPVQAAVVPLTASDSVAAPDSGEQVDEPPATGTPARSEQTIEDRLDSQIDRVDALIEAMRELADAQPEEEG